MNNSTTHFNAAAVRIVALVLGFSSLLYVVLQYGFSLCFAEGSNSPYALAGIVVSAAFFYLLTVIAKAGTSVKLLGGVFSFCFGLAFGLGLVADGIYLFAPHDPNDFTVTDNYLAAHEGQIYLLRLLSLVIGAAAVVAEIVIALITRKQNKHLVALAAVCLMWLACMASIWSGFLGLSSDMVLSSTLFAVGMSLVVWAIYRTTGAKWPLLLLAALLVASSFVAEYHAVKAADVCTEELPAMEEELLLEETEAVMEEEGYVEEEGFADEAGVAEEEYSEEEGFVEE